MNKIEENEIDLQNFEINVITCNQRLTRNESKRNKKPRTTIVNYGDTSCQHMFSKNSNKSLLKQSMWTTHPKITNE